MYDRTTIVKGTVILLFCYLAYKANAFVVVGERFQNKGLKQNVWSLDEIKDKDTVTELRVVNQDHLFYLSQGDISNFKFLKRFAVQGNISRISPGAFINLPDIREIRIFRADLTRLHTMTFANLTVRRLTLHANGLSYVEDDVFWNLTKLEEVDLSENKLYIWREVAFRNTPNVKSLFLRANLLRRLTDTAFDGFPNLLYLDLSFNELKVVGHFVHGLPRLLTLILQQNRLRMLPDDFFAPNHSLATKETQHNYERSFETIDLTENQLSYLSDTIWRDIIRTENLLIGSNPWNCACYNQMLVWGVKHRITIHEKNAQFSPICITANAKVCQKIDDNETIEHYLKNVPRSYYEEKYSIESPEPHFPI